MPTPDVNRHPRSRHRADHCRQRRHVPLCQHHVEARSQQRYSRKHTNRNAAVRYEATVLVQRQGTTRDKPVV